MTFACPHCKQPIDPALVRRAANTDAARRERPGAKGLVRNAKGRPKAGLCDVCHKPLRFPSDNNPMYIDDTWVTSLCRHTIRLRK